MSDLLKWGLIGVGGYLLYQRFVAAPAAAAPTGSAGGTTGAPSPTGSFSIADLLAALKATGNPPATTNQGGNETPPPQVCPAGYTGTYPNCVAPVTPPPATPTVKFDSSDYGSQAWKDRVASAMTAAAGGNGRSYDDWSFYYQNQVGGSPISPALFGGTMDAGGATRGEDGATPLVTAEDFVVNLVKAKTSGLSGIRTPLRIPVPAYSRRVKALPVPPVAVIHLGNGRTALLNMGGN